eukprot:scaffold60761_cov58-Phaeocystis_antarctica.AAC.3
MYPACNQARHLRVDIAADELRLVRRVVERRDNLRPVQVVEALGEKVVGVDVEDHLEFEDYLEVDQLHTRHVGVHSDLQQPTRLHELQAGRSVRGRVTAEVEVEEIGREIGDEARRALHRWTAARSHSRDVDGSVAVSEGGHHDVAIPARHGRRQSDGRGVRAAQRHDWGTALHAEPPRSDISGWRPGVCGRDEARAQHEGIVIVSTVIGGIVIYGARKVFHRHDSAAVVEPHGGPSGKATEAVTLRERIADGDRDRRDVGRQTAHLEGLVRPVTREHKVGEHRGGTGGKRHRVVRLGPYGLVYIGIRSHEPFVRRRAIGRRRAQLGRLVGATAADRAEDVRFSRVRWARVAGEGEGGDVRDGDTEGRVDRGHAKTFREQRQAGKDHHLSAARIG